jgi:hypothetical protein
VPNVQLRFRLDVGDRRSWIRQRGSWHLLHQLLLNMVQPVQLMNLIEKKCRERWETFGIFVVLNLKSKEYRILIPFTFWSLPVVWRFALVSGWPSSSVPSPCLGEGSCDPFCLIEGLSLACFRWIRESVIQLVLQMEIGTGLCDLKTFYSEL